MSVSLALLAATACVRPDPAAEARAAESERRAAAAEASSRAAASENEGLRAKLTELDPPAARAAAPAEQQSDPDAGKAPPCPAQTVVWVRTDEGTDCDTYRAEIRGWSQACVADCSDAARLAEAIAAAQAECAAFCARKKCGGGAYVPPAKCAASSCLKSSDCPANCPLANKCFLLQGELVWNCSCVVVDG